MTAIPIRSCTYTVPFIILFMISMAGCESVTSPDQTPERVVGNFLGDVGLGLNENASNCVVTASQSKISEWAKILYFPSHSNPPSSSDKTKLDRFITHFYRITLTDSTDTEATVSLVFAATDAHVGFPSVADDPTIPNSAMYEVSLVRESEMADDKEVYGPWKIVELTPATSYR